MAGFTNLAQALAAFNQASGQNLTQQNWGARDATQRPDWAGAGVGPQTGQGEFNSWLANIRHAGVIPGYTYDNQNGPPTAAAQGSGTGTPGSQSSSSLTGTLQNALQPTYLGAPPTLNAATYGGTTVAPAATLSDSLLASMNPNATIAQIQAGFAPQNALANQNLQNTLAAAGVSGGPAVQASEQLANAQAAGMAPALASAIQNSQANVLSGNEYNAGATNANNLAQAGYNEQTGLANMTATNDANATNLGNLINTNQYNTGLANSQNNNLLNLIMQGFNTNQQQFNTLNNSGLGGANNLTQQGLSSSGQLANNVASTFPVQSGAAGAFGNLGASLGNYYGNQQQGQSTYAPGSANVGSSVYNPAYTQQPVSYNTIPGFG